MQITPRLCKNLILSRPRTTLYSKSFTSRYGSLQKELKAIREEKDSLKLALQIVSKDLYQNSAFVMQPDNIHVDTDEYQDIQDSGLVGK